MLAEIFKSVLLMSAAGGVLSVFLLCVKLITRKLFSPKWQYYIWLTVLIVMVLPVRFSMPKQTPNISNTMTEQVQNVQTDIEMPIINNQTAITAPAKQAGKLLIPKFELPQNIFYYLSCIWLFGAIFILLAKIIKYHLFLRAIHKNSYADNTVLNMPKRLCVHRTDMLDAPLIIGLIKPALYLPDMELSEGNLNYILMHELTHYRRHDLMYKWFAMFVLSVHWFNPLIHIVSKQIDLDCEVSCDADVAGKLSKAEQDSYMNMILDMLANSGSTLRPLTTQMASSKRILKRRFEMIRNKRRTGKLVSALSAVIAVVILGTTVFASGVIAGTSSESGHFYINGKAYGITPVFIENTLSAKTDSWYVPLRKTFEALGYEVKYDVDKSKYTISDNIAFPSYDAIVHNEGYDDNGEWYSIDYNGDEWKKPLVTSDVNYYIYGATERLNRQMPIIEMTKGDVTEYCQIGSRKMSTGYVFSAPTLIDGKAYIPIRAVAYIVGGEDNVKWNDETHDTYYEGVLTFDEESLTITVDTDYPNTDFENSEFMENNIAECLKNADFSEPYSYKLVKRTSNYMNGGTEVTFKYDIVPQNGDTTYYLVMTFAYDKDEGRWHIYDSSFGDGQISYTGSEGLHNPKNCVKAFFNAFSQREFNVMPSYCTQNCVEKFFGHGYCFGMTQATLTDMNIDMLEYAKSSNDFNVFVTVNMTPHENSVFDMSETSTSFYVILQRQPDGRYLIDEFATGL